MTNESGLEPRGRAVLVKHYQPEQKGSLIVIPDHVKASAAQLEQRAIVVAIGPAAWPDEVARAEIGEKVLISKFAGYLAKGPKDGELYALVNDRDIFAAIVEEA